MTIHDPITTDLRSRLTDPDLFREAALIDGTWIARADMPVTNPATGT